jgi:hypothetical protein
MIHAHNVFTVRLIDPPPTTTTTTTTTPTAAACRTLSEHFGMRFLRISPICSESRRAPV